MNKLPRWKLECYVNEDGTCPILIFISGLAEQAQAEAEALKTLLEKHGDEIEGRCSSHGDGLFEIWGEYVRLFYKFTDNDRLILIDGALPEQGNRPLKEILRKANLI